MTDALFRRLAPRIMRDLMREFDLGVIEAAAILGNLGHESGGFRFLQEKKPLIPGSRGGWGWAQWTGDRRRAFEKWIAERGLKPESYEANYGFLVHELRNTSEKKAIPAVKRARGLAAKVKAFELAFERASPKHKHYPSREKWAGIALDAFHKAQPADEPEPPPAGVLTDATLIREAQARLRALGYHMVGEPDGRWGPRSIAALSAFEKQANLPVTGNLTKDRFERIMRDDAPALGVSPERSAADEGKVAEKVPEVAEAKKAESRSLLGMIGAFFAGIVAWVKDQLADAVEAIRPAVELLSDVPGWVWALVVIGMLFATYKAAR
ncbi:MAG: phage tail tip lysozyme, partial [Beijerinckiaceae bacterium]